MRSLPSIIHLDMDAFFAAVEQAAKPSLRGKPVIVGGLGGRGVVSTASYEARKFGVHSAMPMAQARRPCPNAAFLAYRFEAYRQASGLVMGLLRELSPLVQPLSLDEAFVDLEAGPYGPVLAEAEHGTGERLLLALAEDLRADIVERTGLTASVGVAASKLMAKIASEQAKPDGLVLIEPGQERAVLGPMPVRALPGIGPATEQVLRRAGLNTVAELAEAGEAELVQLLGKAHGVGVHAMSTGLDDRPVVADQDAKSVSVEDTFEVDLADRDRVLREVEALALRCVRRLRGAGRSGRTVVLKVRRFDFSTLTRSETLRGPTDDEAVVVETARRLRPRRWTSRAGCGCWASGWRSWPTTPRRTSSRRPSGRRRRPGPRPGRAWRRSRSRPRSRWCRCAAGCPGRTSGMRSTGRGGCRAAGWGG